MSHSLLASPQQALASADSMFVKITPPAVLAREKKMAKEKKIEEKHARYCAGEKSICLSNPFPREYSNGQM